MLYQSQKNTLTTVVWSPNREVSWALTKVLHYFLLQFPHALFFLRHRGGENMACMRTVMAVIVPQFIWLDGLKNMFQPHEMSYGPRGPRPHAGSPVASLYSHILQIPQEG